jgi:hypothetical protein
VRGALSDHLDQPVLDATDPDAVPAAERLVDLRVAGVHAENTDVVEFATRRDDFYVRLA